MWYAKIDDKNQTFVIETREGECVVEQRMPSTSSPNPGREVLMSRPLNKEAWERIWELVEAANRGSV